MLIAKSTRFDFISGYTCEQPAQVPICVTGWNIIHLLVHFWVLNRSGRPICFSPPPARQEHTSKCLCFLRRNRHSNEAFFKTLMKNLLRQRDLKRTWYESSEHCSSSSNWQAAPPRAATIPDSHWLSFTELRQHCFCATLMQKTLQYLQMNHLTFQKIWPAQRFKEALI